MSRNSPYRKFILGIEGSAGLIRGTSRCGGKITRDFSSVGPGFGLNASGDFFVGYLPGDVEDLAGNSLAINAVAGLFSVTFLFDSRTGKFLAGTAGIGPNITPFIPLQTSVSIARTTIHRTPFQIYRERFEGKVGEAAQEKCRCQN